MLGDGSPELELGELGGGELLLDEQPARARAALSSKAGALPRKVLYLRRFMGQSPSAIPGAGRMAGIRASL